MSIAPRNAHETFGEERVGISSSIKLLKSAPYVCVDALSMHTAHLRTGEAQQASPKYDATRQVPKFSGIRPESIGFSANAAIFPKPLRQELRR